MGLILLILFLVLVFGGGGWGYSRYGGWGMSPAVVILVIGVILYFSGHLNFNWR